MKVIEPTPSQAAVAVQKLLSKNGVAVQLGLAQEAVAVCRGYPSWNVLAADMDPRGRVRKDKSTAVPVTEPAQEQEPEVFDPPCVDPGPLLRHFVRRSMETKTEKQALDLMRELESYLSEQPKLLQLRRMPGRDECAMEEASPYIQVSFEKPWNQAFATELVFTLRDHKMQCYVRTWEFEDRLRPSRTYGIFMEQDGRFDTNAPEVDDMQPLADLVRSALAELERHKQALQDEVNVK